MLILVFAVLVLSFAFVKLLDQRAPSSGVLVHVPSNVREHAAREKEGAVLLLYICTIDSQGCTDRKLSFDIRRNKNVLKA